MSDQVFGGKTGDAEAPFLSADFWDEGTIVKGVVVREFDTQNGKSYVLHLSEPVTIDGEECDEVSVGNMAGFRMALQAAKLKGLLEGDKVTLSCYGKTLSKKEGNSARVDFELIVRRPEPVHARAAGF